MSWVVLLCWIDVLSCAKKALHLITMVLASLLGLPCCYCIGALFILKKYFSNFLSVNYRGSIGFGQDSIDSLPGNIGTQDVNDVQVGFQV